MTTRVVVRLQVEPPLERLPVEDLRFSLDPCAPRLWGAAADLSIPGPEVADDAKRDLRSPSERGIKPRSQPLEQGQLRTIPDRIARRIRANCKLEAQYSAIRAQKLQVRKRHFTTLELTDPCVGGTDRPANVGLTQSGSGSRQTAVICDLPDRIPAAPPATVGEAFARDHRRIVTFGALPLLTWDRRTLSVRMGGREPSVPSSYAASNARRSR